MTENIELLKKIKKIEKEILENEKRLKQLNLTLRIFKGKLDNYNKGELKNV